MSLNLDQFELLEQYNEASREVIDIDPKVRRRGVETLLRLYYTAPQLKVSIVSKLEQLAGDKEDFVAKYATQALERVRSGQQYYRPYSPYGAPPSTTPPYKRRTEGPAQPQKQGRNIAANIVCCVIMIIMYFIITYVIF